MSGRPCGGRVACGDLSPPRLCVCAHGRMTYQVALHVVARLPFATSSTVEVSWPGSARFHLRSRPTLCACGQLPEFPATLASHGQLLRVWRGLTAEGGGEPTPGALLCPDTSVEEATL